MIEKIELTSGMLLIIIIWLACTIATVATKRDYINTAVVFTILYGLYRFFKP